MSASKVQCRAGEKPAKKARSPNLCGRQAEPECEGSRVELVDELSHEEQRNVMEVE